MAADDQIVVVSWSGSVTVFDACTGASVTGFQVRHGDAPTVTSSNNGPTSTYSGDAAANTPSMLCAPSLSRPAHLNGCHWGNGHTDFSQHRW